MKLVLQPGDGIVIDVPCRRKRELRQQESNLVGRIRDGEPQSLNAKRWLRKIQRQRIQWTGESGGLGYVKIKGDIEKS